MMHENVAYSWVWTTLAFVVPLLLLKFLIMGTKLRSHEPLLAGFRNPESTRFPGGHHHQRLLFMPT